MVRQIHTYANNNQLKIGPAEGFSIYNPFFTSLCISQPLVQFTCSHSKCWLGKGWASPYTCLFYMALVSVVLVLVLELSS